MPDAPVAEIELPSGVTKSSIELQPEAMYDPNSDDQDGRPVITWAQYLARRAAGRRSHGFDIVLHPIDNPRGPHIRMQATKWLKWYGKGWQPEGYVAERTPEQPADVAHDPAAQVAALTEQVTRLVGALAEATGKDFVCEQCGESFKQQRYLDRHRAEKH